MEHPSCKRLRHLLDQVPQRLEQISDTDFSAKPSPLKWSKKEILGHLIDSAANNHQRFIRIQFQENQTIVYQQNEWVFHSHYQELPSSHIISFWELYNRHLLEVILRIPEENMHRTCLTGGPDPVTLRWLIDDYVVHMEHHLRQIVSYE